MASPTLRVPFTPPPSLNSSSVYLFQTSLSYPCIPPAGLSCFHHPSPARLRSYPSFTHYLFTFYGAFLHCLPLLFSIFAVLVLHTLAIPLRHLPFHPFPSVQTSSPNDYNAGEVEVVPCRVRKTRVTRFRQCCTSFPPQPELLGLGLVITI